MKRPFASVGIRQADISDSVRARFLAKVAVAGLDDCWEWTGSRTKQGYGRFQLPPNGCTTAQRVAFAIFVGDLAPGLTVDHTCENHGCVNGRHLEAVPHRVNVLRSNGVAAQHARKTRCHRGHPLTQGKTQRFCRTCKREKGRAWMRQHRSNLRARSAA